MMPLTSQMTTMDAGIIGLLVAVCFILFLMSLYLFKELQFLRDIIAGIEQAQKDQWDHINNLEKIVILNPELEKKKQKPYNLKMLNPKPKGVSMACGSKQPSTKKPPKK